MSARAVLVGLPGAGKSTIGRRLAHAMHIPFIDTDARIEQREKRSCSDIFAQEGEAYFRAVEAEVVKESVQEDAIVALGGGAVVTQSTRDLLACHTVVYLQISVEEGLRRTSGRSGRPLLNVADPRSKYEELYAQRYRFYEEVASIAVHSDSREPHRVVSEILNFINDYE